METPTPDQNEENPAPESAAPAPESAPPDEGPLLKPASKDDQNMAMFAHLLGILIGFIGPLIIYLIKNEEKESFARQEAIEALNFQIAVAIAAVISGALMMVCIGLILMPLVVVGNIVFCILAALQVNKGEPYRYPFTFRMIK
ncbi:MAG: DUF4870 domain-containing protein [Phycisphaerales bacterium]|nr:DUF4870 domain-containing protein [Phycisphaerales bacterium]